MSGGLAVCYASATKNQRKDAMLSYITHIGLCVDLHLELVDYDLLVGKGKLLVW